MVMVRSSPQKILRHLGSSWCEWLAGTRWPDFFVVQFQSISSLWTWKLERPKEELARYGDFSCVLCHFHDWKCQVGFVSLFRLSHLGKKGSQFWRLSDADPMDPGTRQWRRHRPLASLSKMPPAACGPKPMSPRPIGTGGAPKNCISLYCAGEYWYNEVVIFVCFFMWFEGFKVQLWIAVNICQALLWHNLQVTDNDRRWKFTVSSVPWIQLWPIGPIRARWPCARPIAQCPFHFILEVNFFWVHSSWVSHIQWPAWWCEISSKSFLPWSKANIFLTCMAWTVLLYLPYAHYMWLCLFATKSCAVRLSMQEDELQTSCFQLRQM